MIRRFLLLAGLLCLAPLSHAEDPKANPALVAYLEKLQLKLDHAAQRANQPTSGASNVVGVRGSKAEPASKRLYWKGKEKPQTVTPDEIRLFRTAVEEARAGQTAEAVVALNTFEERYPKSALRPDAEEMSRLLSASRPAVAASSATTR